nr:MAG TPA: hypothetical protein [Caudoviricetes sp.]
MISSDLFRIYTHRNFVHKRKCAANEKVMRWTQGNKSATIEP